MNTSIATNHFFRAIEAGRGPPGNKKNFFGFLQITLAIIRINTYIIQNITNIILYGTS
jgi:hypothetical protein